MNGIIKECETRVRRTYRGGALLDVFLGRQRGTDGFFPEDWISSFVEAKNRDYIPGEGITRLEDGRLITDAVGGGMFGQGRTEPGVLIKLLDSGERLGIQVHPTDAYAKKLFGSDYGKTESWHVLSTRRINDEEPRVYLGFKPGLTRELWTEYYRTQNVNAMLNALHEIPVKPGDTILVAGGTPHAIGGGCMLLEIQQPSDYTMRCETTPLSGVPYTPAQIHYGAGEQAMLDCFSYTPMTRAELERNYILRPRASTGDGWERLDHIIVNGDDCPVFDLDFGRIGIMICFDNYCPEIARIMGNRGAELILYPLYGDTLNPQWELKMRARAVDSSVYVASCQIDNVTNVAYTGLVSPTGDVLCRLEGYPSHAVVEVDLGKKLYTNTMNQPGQRELIREYLKKCRHPSSFKGIMEEPADTLPWEDIFEGTNWKG